MLVSKLLLGPTCKEEHSQGRMGWKMPSLARRNTSGNVELLRNWRIASSVVHCGPAPSLASRALFRSQSGLVCPRRVIPDLTRNFSEFSCCDTSGSQFFLLTVTAGVACHTRPSWQPPAAFATAGVFGTTGFRFGKCGCTRLPGSRRQGLSERQGPGHGPGATRRPYRRLEIVADGLPLSGSAVSGRHDTRICLEARWRTTLPKCR